MSRKNIKKLHVENDLDVRFKEEFYNASNRLHALNGRKRRRRRCWHVSVCMCVCALANSNLKSCKDHVDDSHPIDLYTFISVNVEDGSFRMYG